MGAIAIIPARYGSTRLEGKALPAETGKPLIQHVVEAVRPAKLIDRIVVATDDERIADAVEAFDCEVVMTRADHVCGTDRLAEAAAALKLPDDKIIVNVQGDEPDMLASCVDDLVELLHRSDAPMATLATPLKADQVSDPAKVKVVFDLAGRAMYFSRSVIPCDRDSAGEVGYFLHLGIYAYRSGFLKEFTRLPQTPAERAEKLEQLRAIEHGRQIVVGVVDYDGAGIDTAEDYKAFKCRQAGRSS